MMTSRGPAIELEVWYIWRLWRGFFNYVDMGGTRRPRAQEMSDLDGRSAEPMNWKSWAEIEGIDGGFPAFKPNIEALGVPFRTRKQRGWYQIRRHPSDHTTVTQQPRSSSSTNIYATGADLPPELINSIIRTLLPPPSSNIVLRVENDYKRTLAICGQVCRHWAKICRISLFSRIILRSRPDMTQLSEFMLSTRKVSVQSYVRQVDLVLTLTSSGTPWIHDARRILINVPATVSLSLVLKGPLPTGSRPLRTVNRDLPRSLPMMNHKIGALLLSDVHFSRLKDLLHLVDELHDIGHFWGEKLTWPREQLEQVLLELPLRRRRPPPTQCWYLSECTEASLICYGLLCRSRWSDAGLYAHPEDVQIIWKMIRVIERNTGISGIFTTAFNDTRDHGIAGSVKFVTDLYGRPSCFTLTPQATLTFKGIEDRHMPGNNSRCRITGVEFEVQSEAFADMDWTPIDETASMFSDLEHFAVQAQDLDTATRFKTTLQDKLKAIERVARLRFQGRSRVNGKVTFVDV